MLGLDTNIPVTDWLKHNEHHVHKLHGITAVSMPDREVLVEVFVQRVSVGPTTERPEILNRLQSGLEGKIKSLSSHHSCRGVRVTSGDYGAKFEIRFELNNGAQFCDTAIAITKKILQILGVEDERGSRMANFTVSQETFIRLDEAWIPFVRWLRMSHQLPVFASVDADMSR